MSYYYKADDAPQFSSIIDKIVKLDSRFKLVNDSTLVYEKNGILLNIDMDEKKGEGFIIYIGTLSDKAIRQINYNNGGVDYGFIDTEYNGVVQGKNTMFEFSFLDADGIESEDEVVITAKEIIKYTTIIAGNIRVQTGKDF